jgi:hypothetical protein
MDGGRILKSIKQSYAEHVGTDTVRDIVRTMMKDQHTAMIVALCDGQFDALFDDPSSGKETLDAHAEALPSRAASAQAHESLQGSPNTQAPPVAAAAKAMARARVKHAGRPMRARVSSILSDTTSQHPSSIFSDDLVDDESLDEVILNYLAEDIESSSRK